ncbi:hypothetical protein [Cohnella herbarum]|uniref:Fibronectin type-III domain-containing protein n=1 Tax=Cohnella herbarum TaxID=2728023 RepID=A0A7Z2VR14_9BACL|nr:hypothetical protein [Cohnella herbarum]QJD87601.1 hypothetical protein HH215_33415 [Cohnella herbarum]
MKKVLLFLMGFALIIGLTAPIKSVSAYSEGLLNGKILEIGQIDPIAGVITPSGNTTNLITDNSEGTLFQLYYGNNAENKAKQYAWYTFDSPVTLNAYKIKADGKFSIRAFDENNNQIMSIGTELAGSNHLVIDGTQQNIGAITGVKTVFICAGTENSNPKIYEFDVFSRPQAPINLSATGGNSVVDLSWTSTVGVTNYTLKRSTSSGGPYTTIATNVTNTFYTDPNVTIGTTYYYVVVAVNVIGESTLSNEASATPIAPPNPGRALLTVYISGGQIKEYDLSATELNAFISWYDAKDAGSGPAKYKFVKTWNKGPFKARSEYVIFDKILTFDVDEYDVVNP